MLDLVVTISIDVVAIIAFCYYSTEEKSEQHKDEDTFKCRQRHIDDYTEFQILIRADFCTPKISNATKM